MVATSVRSSAGAAIASNGDGQGSDDDEDAVDGEEEPEIAAEFSDCINICQSARFKSFQDSRSNRMLQFHSKLGLT